MEKQQQDKCIGGLSVQPSTLKVKSNGPTEICLNWQSSYASTPQNDLSSERGSQGLTGIAPIDQAVSGITDDPIGTAAKVLPFLI